MLGVMEKYDVLPSQINVEITETEMINAFSVVNSNLRELVDNGIEISLDDYGSGYANINYMNHMPFKFVKIDKDIIGCEFCSYRDICYKTEKDNIELEKHKNLDFLGGDNNA